MPAHWRAYRRIRRVRPNKVLKETILFFLKLPPPCPRTGAAVRDMDDEGAGHDPELEAAEAQMLQPLDLVLPVTDEALVKGGG